MHIGQWKSEHPNERGTIFLRVVRGSNFFSRKHRGDGGNSTFDLWERGCGCNLCSGTSLRLLYRRLTQRANHGLLLQERSMPVYSMNRRRDVGRDMLVEKFINAVNWKALSIFINGGFSLLPQSEILRRCHFRRISKSIRNLLLDYLINEESLRMCISETFWFPVNSIKIKNDILYYSFVNTLNTFYWVRNNIPCIV